MSMRFFNVQMCECANVRMLQMCEWSPWVNVQMCEWLPSFVVIINYD